MSADKPDQPPRSTPDTAPRTFRAFFSYALDDAATDPELVKALTEELEQRVNAKFVNDKFEIWRDAEDIRLADKWGPKIDAALKSADILIVLLTPRWLGSDFCRSEYKIFTEAEAARGNASPTEGYVAVILGRDVDGQKEILTPEQAEILQLLEASQHKKVPANNRLALSKTRKRKLIDELADDILNIVGRLRVAPVRSALPTPVAGLAPATAEIPRTPEHFLGRDEDVAAVVNVLLQPTPSCAVLIQGPPGIGKTALTKAIANHEDIKKKFADANRWFVELERATTAAELQDAITRAVGAEPQGGFKAALALLHQRPGLLVLDNLETPWEPQADRRTTEDSLAALAAIPGVAVLASFRGLDRVRGPVWTTVRTVNRLKSPFDKELFQKIAEASFEGDANLSPFLSALEGIPLAIELVAQRAYSLTSLADLWKQWTDIGAALAVQPGFKAGRLTSLPHSIELSLGSGRMNETAVRLFKILGQLPAGMAAEDRDTLLGTAGFDGEEALRKTGLAIDREGRLDLLLPIRDHARRHHLPLPPDDAGWSAHYLDIGRLGERIGSAQGAGVMTRLLPEFANISAAIAAVLAARPMRREEAMAALNGFARLAYIASLQAPILSQLAAACVASGDFVGEAHCLKSLGDIALGRSEHDVARKAYQAALPLFRKEGNLREEANCICRLGDIARDRSDHDTAHKAYEDALPLFRKVDDALGEAGCIYSLGEIALRNEDLDAAQKAYETALPLFRSEGSMLGEANCLKRFGDTALRRNDYDTARKAYEETLPIYRSIGEVLGEAGCIENLGDIWFAHQDYDAAQKAYENALPRFREIGNTLGEANCVYSLGDIARARLDDDAAQAAYEEALARYRMAGDVRGEANCLYNFGRIASARSDYGAARKAYQEALSLYRRIGSVAWEANCNEALDRLNNIGSSDGDKSQEKGNRKGKRK